MASDPWDELQRKYKERPSPASSHDQKPLEEDPWEKLRALYLPFTEEEETSALTDPEKAHKVSGYLHKALLPYEKEIEKTAKRFDIPEEIIGAVIMVESGGNRFARAKTSSAKGLMQTIDSTFREAYNALDSTGLKIKYNPFHPYSSIMAGSWYLDRMFEKALNDKKQGVRERQNISSWRFPLEYYYAGPGNGVKEENVVIIYSGGKRVVVDKGAYSSKVMRWARILSYE